MRAIETPRFGLVRYDEQEVIEFPAGLPGFEGEHQFLLIEPEASRPLCFLQSVATPGLSFVCTDTKLVDPSYEFALSRTDRETLAMPAHGACPGTKLRWLFILCFAKPEAPTANLLGPIVIRREVALGVQSIREDSRYSARHPLFSEVA
jgi:flagellar assembly factor FliW